MNKIKNFKIAIDGHASCGKSTLAKKLAKKLNCLYIDTGAMYRAVTFFAIKNNCIVNKLLDADKLVGFLDKINIDFEPNNTSKSYDVRLNGTNIEQQIRGLEVSEYVSQVATVEQVRTKLVKQQQAMADNISVVMDGRDIGTIVFPDAEIKIFLTASAEVRAERRYKEMLQKNMDVKYDDILRNVVIRDKIDSSREVNPLKQANDAILIDSTNLNIQETFAVVMAIFNERF